MNIKAIVSDFDGTLVGATHTVTPGVRDAIKKFINAGRIFSIATGRAYEGLLDNVCKELCIDGLVIVRGGSEIISTQTGEVVWGQYIASGLVSKIIAQLEERSGIIVLAESGKDLFTVDGQGNAEFATGAHIKKFVDLPMDKVPKIAIPPLYNKEVIEPIFEKLAEQYNILHIVKTTSKNGMGIDINDGKAGKHVALFEYSKLIGVDPGEILGVGDSYNDYPLLSACGVRAAMGNAPDELKEIADFIVETQEHDGIVEVINKVIS
jgi:hypothetical protein